MYIGDVPVSQTMSGSILLWRLLDGYPDEALMIVETLASKPAARLPKVRYRTIFKPITRLTRSRLSPIVAPILIATARARARVVKHLARRFEAQAILTVSHGVSWLMAAEVASQLKLPLHMINHDWWLQTVTVPRMLRGWLTRQFGLAYRQAQVRFCVSPQMAAYYQRKYNAEGCVLYPGRSRQAAVWTAPPVRTGSRPFTLAYAGGIFYDCAAMLKGVASILRETNGRLVIFSDMDSEVVAGKGLAGNNIILRGFVSPAELTSVLRAEVDALLVTRERGMGINAIISFPSKLVEYTATGLPIIICAPLDSAAAAWESEHKGAALVVADGDVGGLRDALESLVQKEGLRRQLGEAALEHGEESFSYEATTGRFLSTLATSHAKAAGDVSSAGWRHW
jgi:glycosyltransferase involved in cell wall biosynthesis